MAFKSRSELIEDTKQAEATLRTYEISKRVKKGTKDSDVINSIMANQTTSSTLAFLNKAQTIRVQEMYQMVNRKQGNIKFDAFWRQLRDCFDKSESLSATEKINYHAMVAFEKPAGRYDEPTMNKRTPRWERRGLISVSIRTIGQNPSRIQIPKTRIKNKDATVIATI